MARTLIVNGNTYTFPDQGANPAWGEEVAGWASDVTDVLDTVVSTTDILNRSFTILNNQTSPTNITGLAFDTALVRGAIIEYSIYRTSSTITSDKAETGTIWLSYDGSSWDLTRETTGDTGVTFTITGTGNVQYISTDVGSTSYSGTINFRARTSGQ